MKKHIFTGLKFALFLGIGLFLFWLIYKDQDTDQLFEELKHVKYSWILFSLFLGEMSHVVRAIRWQMLVRPYQYYPGFLNSFFAVTSTYFANLAIPRLGEVVRPSVLKKYENIPFPISFGTIVLERIIDVLMLLSLTLFLVLTQSDIFMSFIHNNPVVERNVMRLLSSQNLWILGSVMLALILLVWGFRNKIKQWSFFVKIKHLIKEFVDGIQSISKLKNKKLFFFYTFLIWLLYYLMTYFPIYAFQGTLGVTPMQGLIIFVIGSYGMVAPVQGGIGTWHFMVTATMVVIGIAEPDARLFALVVHAAQTFMLAFFGFLSVILLPIVNNTKSKA